MPDEEIQERLKYAANCLGRFDEMDISVTENLRDELDFLRRSILTNRPEFTEKQILQEARQTFPRRVLQAILKLADLNSVIPSSSRLT